MIYETKNGNQSIYASSEITEPSHKGLPDKSFFEDKRGSVNFFKVGGQAVNLFFTKKGFKRGGDIHKNNQYNIIISGKVKLVTLEGGRILKTILKKNSFIIIKPHIPHLFEFLEDTVMIEWWGGHFRAWYYKPFRDMISASK